MKEKEDSSLSFVVFSGINFPSKSRRYLIDLVYEIGKINNAKFFLGAGHTLSGKDLERDLQNRLREINGKNADKEKTRVREEFVNEVAASFSEFLPPSEEAKYHFVVAESVYDRPIGSQILDVLSKLRPDDVRIINDPEAKMPINLPGFGEMRVIVPRKQPWFYENVTGLMQRLINSFAAKTRSPKPALIIVGCTGTGAYLPRYKGVPSIAVPTLHIIEEQISTENMVGCVVVKITLERNYFRTIVKTYDFRTAIFSEQSAVFSRDIGRNERIVLETLLSSSAGVNTVLFRVNERVKNKPWSKNKVQGYLNGLLEQKLITYNERSNRYAISELITKQAKITLDELSKDSKIVTFVQESCSHAGALKALYYTTMEDEVRLGEVADVHINNGDLIQGISHNYEYNGELLPIMNGVDKQEIFAALLKARSILKIFEKRWNKFSGGEIPFDKLLKKCLLQWQYKHGNHDEPRFSRSKNSIPLALFDKVLKETVTSGIMQFLEKKGVDQSSFSVVKALVDQRIIRIGERRVAEVELDDGTIVPIGVKHPYQARTKSKGARVQETAAFFDHFLQDWPEKELRKLAIVAVANFHEAAAIFTSIFGKTIFGLMTGAQLKDTQFESNNNKVVDYGLARATVTLGPGGQLLAAEVEFSDRIDRRDRKIAFANILTAEDVARRCLELSKEFNLSWR